MSFKETQIWDCPFCGKNVLPCDYIPRTLRPYKTSWGGSKPGWKRSMEQIVVRFEKCPNCGKSAEEIEKRWKEEGIL